MLGIVGFDDYFRRIGEPRSFGTLLYLTAELFSLYDGGFSLNDNFDWQLQVARFLAPAVAGYTGLRALAALFSEQLQGFRLRFRRGHIVLCGLGEKGALLAGAFLDRGYAVVAIERNLSNGLAQQARRDGAIVLIGDATDTEVLLRAGVLHAEGLIAVCGDDDSNAEIAIRANQLTQARPGRPLKALAHLIDPQLCDLFKRLEIGSAQTGGFRLQFFNVFDGGARAVLQDHPPFEGAAHPHLLVLGVGHIGQRIVFHAARRWQETHHGRQHLRITLLDREADRIKDFLCARYPHIASACRIAAFPIDPQSADFHQGRFLLDAAEEAGVTIAYVCLDDDAASLSAALTLRQQIRDTRISIVACLTGSPGLAALLQDAGTKDSSFGGLQAFRVLDRTCTPSLLLDSTNELLARAYHEDFLRHELAAGRTHAVNPSIVPWEELPEARRESSRRAVDHIPTKLHAVGCELVPLTDWDAELFEFTPAEVEQLSELEHTRWLEERTGDGWKYGPVRDDSEKIHPDLLPWPQLSDDSKEKNRTFIRGLPAYLASVGFQVTRHPSSVPAGTLASTQGG